MFLVALFRKNESDPEDGAVFIMGMFWPFVAAWLLLILPIYLAREIRSKVSITYLGGPIVETKPPCNAARSAVTTACTSGTTTP